MTFTKKNKIKIDTSSLDGVTKSLIESITKEFGEGTLIDPGSMEYQPIDVIPTGSIALDLALVVGGIPRGRVTEIFGPESSGKTTLVNHIIANAQKNNPGKIVWLGDLEHAYDKQYATKCGVDHNSGTFLVTQPKTGEQAFDVAEAIIKSGNVCLVAFDSADAITPEAEVNGNAGDSHPGARARLIAQGLRKLTPIADEHNVAIVFTNQLREKIGAWGNPEVTPGGHALKFYSSVRIRMKKISEIKQGDKTMGVRSRASVIKSKVAAPYGIAEFDIMFAEGISRESGLLDLGEETGVVRKAGAYYYYGEMSAQGKDKARQYLRENKDVAEEIEAKIRASKVVIPVEKDIEEEEEGEEL